jgi:glycosyltransferase involved in cell wall biosynthesis
MRKDVIVFPTIDWSFQRQRPQQIAIELGRRGHRVFYLAEGFAAGNFPRPYLFWGSPAENVYIVQLRCSEPHPSIYKDAPTAPQASALTEGLAALRASCDISAPISIVDLPFWRAVVSAQENNTVVYDCMDYHAGFKHNGRRMLEEEERLVMQADIVVTSSASLSERVARLRPNILIRNGCEPAHFAPRADLPIRRLSDRRIVGYFGVLDHWLDTALVVQAARTYQDWDFVLIGRRQDCNLDALRRLSNIRIVDEKDYAVLPQFAHGFDVCIIPFLINDLTFHTNPVKMYEYLAAGKPVVGTAMPELLIADDLVHVARDREEFIAKLADAMVTRDVPEQVARRIAFASRETWADRVDRLESALADLTIARSLRGAGRPGGGYNTTSEAPG